MSKWKEGLILTSTHEGEGKELRLTTERLPWEERKLKLLLKRVCVGLLNLLVSNAATFTSNSNDNVSKNDFEQPLHAHFFHILSHI